MIGSGTKLNKTIFIFSCHGSRGNCDRFMKPLSGSNIRKLNPFLFPLTKGNHGKESNDKKLVLLVSFVAKKYVRAVDC